MNTEQTNPQGCNKTEEGEHAAIAENLVNDTVPDAEHKPREKLQKTIAILANADYYSRCSNTVF